MHTLTRLVFAGVLLSGPAVAHAQTPEPEAKKIPSDSLEIATTGCLKGRVFTATQPREDFMRRGPNVTGRNFRLNGPRAVIDVVKTHDGDLVEIVGLVRKNDLRDNAPGRPHRQHPRRHRRAAQRRSDAVGAGADLRGHSGDGRRRRSASSTIAARSPARNPSVLEITPTLSLDEREIEERFVRASGPGGQNVNKVSTAVQLRFDVHASSLPFEVKTRLNALAGKRLTIDGVLVIDSREHRTQAMNREAARARLVALIEQATHRPKSRRATKPGKGQREQRLGEKRVRSEVKANRQRRPGGDD